MANKKLFVVDDEVDFAEFVVDVAEGVGFDVSSTSDPAEFTQLFTHDLNVIVLDLFMPVIDGIELLRYIAKQKSQAAIIFMSGKDQGVLHSAQELAVEHGVTVLGVNQKPFLAQELETLLLKYVAPAISAFSPASELPSLAELQDAIAQEQFFLAYQPQVNISNRKVVGVEALVRWQHPQKGMISPGYFIPMAEKNNLIANITAYVSKAAIRQQGLWKAVGINLRMSINISPKILDDLDMPEKLAVYAQEMNVDPSDIVIEVTETALMSDIVRYMDILTRLRMKGFNLSIDDFGTGYSSLQQLVRVPFTELKIDQTFILKLLTDSECSTITEISIILAHKLGMRVVAEGIENEDVWNALKKLGCDEGQGFWMGRPMSAEVIEAWMDGWMKIES